MSEKRCDHAGVTGMSEPEYESKQQLAARLGVSTRTIDNLMARGLPYLALTGKLRRFPRTTVDAWLRQQEVRRG
jgi:excisionase family DNA binding protein